MSRRLVGALVAALFAVLVAPVAPVAPVSADVGVLAVNLRTPFNCGQVWRANTRSGHSPRLAVDFQRAAGDALNKNVRSSAAGTVETVRNLGNSSYGKYIVIRHAEGWKTYYAHLNSFNVSVGQSVSTGTLIGKVGNTGNSNGAHLHYEQRRNGVVQRVVLNGVAIRYYGNTTITSSTGC